jgi:hypothetical protein
MLHPYLRKVGLDHDETSTPEEMYSTEELGC